MVSIGCTVSGTSYTGSVQYISEAGIIQTFEKADVLELKCNNFGNFQRKNLVEGQEVTFAIGNTNIFNGELHQIVPDSNSTLKLSCRDFSGKLVDRTINQDFRHRELSNIISNSTDGVLRLVSGTDGGVLAGSVFNTGISTADQAVTGSTKDYDAFTGSFQKVGQMFHPATSELFQIDVLVGWSSGGKANFEIRNNNGGVPDAQIQNFSNGMDLVAGWNTITNLGFKGFTANGSYFLTCERSAGSFALAASGTNDSSKVKYSSATLEAWGAGTATRSLNFRTYYASGGKMVEFAQFKQMNLFDAVKSVCEPDYEFYVNKDKYFILQEREASNSAYFLGWNQHKSASATAFSSGTHYNTRGSGNAVTLNF